MRWGPFVLAESMSVETLVSSRYSASENFSGYRGFCKGRNHQASPLGEEDLAQNTLLKEQPFGIRSQLPSAYKAPCHFDYAHDLLSRRRDKWEWESARKTPADYVLMVMENHEARQLGEGIILPFANIYSVSCTHSEEYASPALEKLTVKLERQHCILVRANIRQKEKKGLLKRKKNTLFLEMLISERDARNNARQN